MRAGISTACFYPMVTERALEWIAQCQVDTAEVFLNSFSEMEESFLNWLSGIARAGGTEIVSLHPFTSGMEPLLLFSNYTRRMCDGMELYRRMFAAAARLGAKWVILHGDFRGKKGPWAQYFERYAQLDELAREEGVRVVQENVVRCIGFEPAFFRAMSQALPDALFVLDTKQAIRAGYSAQEMAQAMGSHICHMHLSDCDDGRDCLPVGQGTFDYAALLAQVHAQGFNGSVIQEVYADNYEYPGELLVGYNQIEQAIQKWT